MRSQQTPSFNRVISQTPVQSKTNIRFIIPCDSPLYSFLNKKISVEEAINEIEGRNNSTIEKNFTKGQVYRIAGEYDNANHFFDLVLVTPNDGNYHANVFLEKGKIATSCNRLEAALEFYEKACSAQLCPVTLNSKGLAYERMGRLDAALACYHEALKMDPRYDSAHLNVGNIHLLKSQSGLNLLEAQKATISFTEAININDKNPSYHFNRALSFQYQRRYAEAEVDFCMAVSLSPTNLEYKTALAALYIEMEHYDDSISTFTSVLSEIPTCEYSLTHLFVAYCLKGDLHNAEQTREQLLKVAPDNFLLLFNSVFYFVQKMDWMASLDCLDELVNRGYDRTGVFMILGSILCQLNCFDEAINVYKAVNSEKTDPGLLKRIGDVYYDLQKYEEAKNNYEEAYRLQPDSKLLKSLSEEVVSPTNGESDTPFRSKLTEQQIGLSCLKTTLASYVLISQGLTGVDNFKNNLFESTIQGEYPQSENSAFYIYKSEFNKWMKKMKTNKYTKDDSKSKIVTGKELYNFVVLEHEGSYRIWCGLIGHFNLAEGKPVLFAGQIHFNRGDILHWNNSSGHYKPLSSEAEKVATQIGFPLDKFFPIQTLLSRISIFSGRKPLYQALGKELRNYTKQLTKILELIVIILHSRKRIK